ncbi:MAG: hypothetical protein SF182_09530 [Deltaproteobacteria bacterium]|nr:hypothetical protein [Deltaproteobacteria bacterium]
MRDMRVAHASSARRSWVLGLALAVATAWPLATARAQDAEEILDEDQMPDATLMGDAGYSWQGDADIDRGGNFSVNRFDIGLLGRAQVADPLRWTNALFFGLSDYDFGGTGGSSNQPWGTILTLRLVSKLTYALDEQWGLTVGGVFIASPESGADWGDSISGGGLLGVDFRPAKKFFISLGAAIITELEDDVTVAPSINMIWLPAPDWAVRVGAVPAAGGSAAAGEVAYKVLEPLEIGLGLLFNQRRFRLDDSGIAPDGVGEENNLPLRLRLGWTITPNFSAHVFAGAALAGELQLDDRNGNLLAKSDYDPAPYVGLRLVGGF